MTLRRTALLLSLCIAAPASAEVRSDNLLELLSHVPSGLIESDPGAWSTLWFADFAAAANTLEPLPVESEADQPAPQGPWARVYLPELGDYVMQGRGDAWEPLVGFGPLDVDAGVVVGHPPETATLLKLNSAVAEQVAPALLANGYVEETRNGVTALVRGEEDYGINIRERVPDDPLGGPLGSSSRVVLDDTLLVHARGWPTLLRMAGEEEPKGHPDLPALAAALDLPEWGETALLQAFFLPHQIELGAPGSGGLPAWRLGMVADLGSGTETVTLALFTFFSRAEAEAAAQRLAETWDDPIPSTFSEIADAIVLERVAGPSAAAQPPKPSLQDITGAEAQTGVAGEGPFVAWLALRAPTQTNGGSLTNRPFQALWRALNARDLAYFGAP